MGENLRFGQIKVNDRFEEIYAIRKKIITRFISLLVMLLLPYFSVKAQLVTTKIPEEDFWNAGLPFITQYTLENYKADSQNWAFTQADNGVM